MRTLLTPLSWVYASVIWARNVLYDHSVIASHASSIPVISVGNVSVGGTGKTPFSAYLVDRLTKAGHHPAIVMRGYGGDETRLHSRLNPGLAVIADRDRVAGIRTASTLGADVAVLDDAYQHRRAKRDLDIVLVSADRWSDDIRQLPAGPLREPLTSLKRAELIVVTQKSVTDAEAAAVSRAIGTLRGVGALVLVARLEPEELISAATGESAMLDLIRGERVLAIAGIGDPASFFAQLAQLGAVITERRFRDHHDYTFDEARQLSAESAGHKYVVTTGKDIVKLASLWPAGGAELWYLSQAVRLTEGAPLVDAALAKLFQRASSIS
ncbi:MAG: tetraacyldisaccharide 4'-kinase [Gemmatimonadaceae bacterium]